MADTNTDWIDVVDPNRLPKGKDDWYKSNIDMLVEASECISYKNIHMIDGKPLYDIDAYFPKWVAEYIKKKLLPTPPKTKQ